MNKKVDIIIIPNQHYDKSHMNGAEYIDVSFNANKYGSGCPCDNKEELRRAIQIAKENIVREGDIPIIKDKRENLNRWL